MQLTQILVSYKFFLLMPFIGLSSPGVHPKVLADQLTLSQPGGADYAHQITTGTPGFSNFLTALFHI